jgi:WD40 repeat protein
MPLLIRFFDSDSNFSRKRSKREKMQLASISDNLKVWQFDNKSSEAKPVPSLNLQATYRHDVDQFYSLAWNHTNQVVAIGGRQPKVHLVQSNNGHLISSLTLSDSDFKSLKIRAIDFSHNSRFLITSVNTPIQLWDLKSRKVKNIFVGHQHPIVSLIFNHNAEYFYSADELGQINIWDVKNAAVHYKFQDVTSSKQSLHPSDHSSYLSCMKISSSAGNYLAAGYFDGSVKIWDCQVGNNIASSSGSSSNPTDGNHLIRKQRIHSEKVTGLAFSHRNPNLLLTAGMDEQLQLIDIHSKPTEINLSVDVNQRLTSVSFHENGINCAVGTVDGNILVYDFRNTRQAVTLIHAHDPNPVHALSFQVKFYLLFIYHIIFI